jgi:enediyne biosynthesis protein E4
MNKKANLPAAGMLLAAFASGFGQPIITNQPQNQTNIAGSTAMFTVGATSVPPLSYQWRSYANSSSYTNIPWGTEATLFLTNVQPTTRRFGVVVSDAGGSVTSALAMVTVLVPPTITSQPTSQTVEVGESTTFSVGVTGTSPFHYQWRLNDEDLAGKTNTSLVLINLQLINGGSYTVVVTNVAGSTNSQAATLTVVPPIFTKITTGTIVTNVGYGISCAWGDYDNDDFIDLILTVASESAPTAQKNVLFHNNRNGTFTKVTNTVVTAEGRDWRGCSWADYDNDGHLDLFVASTDVVGFPAENELFRNNGDGTFTKMTTNSVGAIVSLAAGGSEGGVWADYDNDGFLDMFVARYGIDWLYHNNGSGVFSGITNNLGGLASEDSYNAAWSDYNNDGRPDLFVAVKSDPPTNRLYLNLGAGSFARVTSGDIATDSAHSFGCAWVDYDNDSYLDLFVCNGGYISGGTNFLYHNNGNGTFTKMASNTVGSIASDTGAFGNCAWGDYDNDGFIDVFVTTYNCCVDPSANFLYHNNGDGTFTRVLSGIVVNDKGFANGCAWGDYNNDGFLDLFVARGANVAQPSLLYRNNGSSNSWLKIKLVGTVSNRSAIGAKVRAQAAIRGQTLWQLRELRAGGKGNPLEAHFGLGDATNVETLLIEWPSGTAQELHNVAAKQFFTITEPPRLSALRSSSNGPFQMQLTCWPGFDFAVETSSNLIDWMSWTRVTTTNRMTRIDDPAGMIEAQRFYRVVFP